jgi:diaminopimelate decarboxylase
MLLCRIRQRPNINIWTRKFLVSEAGSFFKVNVIKQTTSTVFAGVDSGFNHLIRPIVRLSTPYRQHIEPKRKERFYSVVGYIWDILSANNRRIQEIKEGDILSFRNAGAYCYSMAQTITRDINQQKHCGWMAEVT